jgi:hypothetical protein
MHAILHNYISLINDPINIGLFVQDQVTFIYSTTRNNPNYEWENLQTDRDLDPQNENYTLPVLVVVEDLDILRNRVACFRMMLKILMPNQLISVLWALHRFQDRRTASDFLDMNLFRKLDHAVLEIRCLLQPGLDRLFGKLLER